MARSRSKRSRSKSRKSRPRSRKSKSRSSITKLSQEASSSIIKKGKEIEYLTFYLKSADDLQRILKNGYLQPNDYYVEYYTGDHVLKGEYYVPETRPGHYYYNGVQVVGLIPRCKKDFDTRGASYIVLKFDPKLLEDASNYVIKYKPINNYPEIYFEKGFGNSYNPEFYFKEEFGKRYNKIFNTPEGKDCNDHESTFLFGGNIPLRYLKKIDVPSPDSKYYSNYGDYSKILDFIPAKYLVIMEYKDYDEIKEAKAAYEKEQDEINAKIKKGKEEKRIAKWKKEMQKKLVYGNSRRSSSKERISKINLRPEILYLTFEMSDSQTGRILESGYLKPADGKFVITEEDIEIINMNLVCNDKSDISNIRYITLCFDPQLLIDRNDYGLVVPREYDEEPKILRKKDFDEWFDMIYYESWTYKGEYQEGSCFHEAEILFGNEILIDKYLVKILFPVTKKWYGIRNLEDLKEVVPRKYHRFIEIIN